MELAIRQKSEESPLLDEFENEDSTTSTPTGSTGLDLPWGNSAEYEVSQKLGKGRFSEVYLGRNVRNQQKCIIKILKPSKKSKILQEIEILEKLSGAPHTCSLVDVLQVGQTAYLVFPFKEAVDLKQMIPSLTLVQSKVIMKQLLLSLRHAHEIGIMHRDIKPSTIIVGQGNELHLEVIDWGLADFIDEEREFNPYLGSRQYKAPEMLLGETSYGAPVDIWSAGCILGLMLLKVKTLFKGISDNDVLLGIIKVLGIEQLHCYLLLTNGTMPLELSRWMTGRIYPGEAWAELGEGASADPAGLDLLRKMLKVNPAERITAEEALAHPFLAGVK